MVGKRFNRFIYILFLMAFLAGGDLFAQETKTINIEAKKYDFTPDTITVNQGDKVILKVTATDRSHGFGIAAYDIDRALPKGETVTIEFVGDKKGKFTIKCTKFCGWGHFGMEAQLVVS